MVSSLCISCAFTSQALWEQLSWENRQDFLRGFPTSRILSTPAAASCPVTPRGLAHRKNYTKMCHQRG